MTQKEIIQNIKRLEKKQRVYRTISYAIVISALLSFCFIAADLHPDVDFKWFILTKLFFSLSFILLGAAFFKCNHELESINFCKTQYTACLEEKND